MLHPHAAHAAAHAAFNARQLVQVTRWALNTADGDIASAFASWRKLLLPPKP